MSPADHERMLEILGEALELPTADRGRFLDQACAGRSDLRAEVERLLAGEAAAERAIPTHPTAATLMPSHALYPPREIGPYRIVREIGAGGMGAVYLATQLSPVKRQVAIKLLLPARSSTAVLARFEVERQALAMMSHPNVAQVYDAGITADGRPYFVMEYVDGVPITQYCDDNRLTTRQRIELFADVCAAIQHAHQKAIIHRDIKPSNVLVMQREGTPIAKVIDFGIAKSIDHTEMNRAQFTEHGQLIGTPEYMSPEQAAAGAMDVDTRSDVYSLGVLLYELLTGALPFDRQALRESAYDEIRRIIREVDPPRPSTRLSALGDDITSVAQARQSDPATHVREVRGELDWITMRALEKDRARRYGTPAELAEDLQRFLRNEAVVAGPPSRVYRVRKFVRRHRTPVMASALVAASLIIGLATTIWQARVATQQRRIAVAEAARAQQQQALAERRFNDVRRLAGAFIFDVDDAIQNQGPTKARQKLVETAREYLDALSKETAEPDLLRELADAYQRIGYVQSFSGRASLGDVEGAAVSFKKAVDAAEALVVAKPDDRTARNLLAGCWHTLGVSHADRARLADAQLCWDKALSIYQQLADTDATDWMAQRNIGMVMHRKANQLVRDGRQQEALAALEQSLAYRTALDARFAGKEMLQADLRTVQSDYATFLNNLSRFPEALTQLENALASARRSLQTSEQKDAIRRELAVLTHRTAEARRSLGQFAEALTLARQLVELRRDQARDDPGDQEVRVSLSGALFTEAQSLMLLGRLSEALRAHEESLELRREGFRRAPDREASGRWLADSLRRTAELHRRLGDAPAALPLIEEAEAITRRRAQAKPNDETAAGAHYVTVGELARVYLALGRVDDAMAVWQVVFPSTPTTSPASQPIEMRSAANWVEYGMAMVEAGRGAQAVEHLAEATKLAADFRDRYPSNWDAQRDACLAGIYLARALHAAGRRDDAAEQLTRANDVVKTYQHAFPQGTGGDLLEMLAAETARDQATSEPTRRSAAAAAVAAARRVLAQGAEAAAQRVIDRMTP